MMQKKTALQVDQFFRKSKTHIAAALALSALAPLSFSVHAQNMYEWTGAEDTNIHNPNNWVNAGSSSSGGSEAVINTNASGVPHWVLDSNYAIQLPNGEEAQHLTIGSGAGSNGELRIIRPEVGSIYPTSASFQHLHVGVDSGTGVLTLDMNQKDESDPTDYRPQMVSMQLQSPDDFALGVGSGSEGTINVLGTGKSLQEQSNYSGSGLNITGHHATDVKIGADQGKGKLNINGGLASVQSAPISLGTGSGSTGEINVLAGGKFVQNVGSVSIQSVSDVFVVGDDGGEGVLNVSGRSATKDMYSRVVLGTGLVVGSGNGSVGEVHIRDGAQIQSAVFQHPGQEPLNRHVVGDDGGAGRVFIDGQGSIWKVLGGTNSLVHSPTGVGDGELYVGHSGTGEVTVSNGGTLSIGTSKYGYYTDPTTGASYSNVELEHTGGTGVLYLGTQADGNGTLSIGGALGATAQGIGAIAVKDIQFGDGEGTVHFNHTDNTGTYEFNTALISGAGQSHILHSNGVTLFNSDQSLFTGKTTITGGHLIVDNKLGGDVEVAEKGTLGGTGNVGDVVLNSGGTLAPGGYNQDRLSPPAVATLTADSVVFNSGSKLTIQGSPSGHIDVLKATTANGGAGTVNLGSGSQLYIQAGAGTWAENTQHVFIDTEGGLAGKFTTVNSNMAFLTSQVEYSADQAYLHITRNSVGFDEIGNTYNERSTGKGIDSLGVGNPVYDTIVSMSAKEANRSFNNLSGEIHANVKGALLTGTRHTRMAVNNHLGAGLQLNEIEPQKNLWVDAWGHTGTIDNDGNSSKLDTQGYGFLMGWDAYQNDDMTLGIATGYEHNKVDTDHIRQSKANTDMLHFMAYGRASVGQVDLKGGIGYAWLDIDTEREITVTDLEGKHKASYNGNMVQAFVEGSHTFKLSDQLGVVPYAGLAYQRVKTNSATEKGRTATALHYHGGSDDLINGTLGVRAQWQLNDKAKLYGDIGWQSNFGNKYPTADLNFAGGKTYDLKGSNLNRNSAVIGFGAQFKTGERSMVRIGYDGEYGNHAKSHAAHANWELRF